MAVFGASRRPAPKRKASRCVFTSHKPQPLGIPKSLASISTSCADPEPSQNTSKIGVYPSPPNSHHDLGVLDQEDVENSRVNPERGSGTLIQTNHPSRSFNSENIGTNIDENWHPPMTPTGKVHPQGTKMNEKNEDGEHQAEGGNVKEKKPTAIPKRFTPINPGIERVEVQHLYPHDNPTQIFIIGCDEAGRGPLIGPVVSAACCWVNGADTRHLAICDSKLVSKESVREVVFEQLMNTPGLIWAVAEMDPALIDKMNILNTALFGMSVATSKVLSMIHPFLVEADDASAEKSDSEDWPALQIPPILPLCSGVDVTGALTQGTTDLLRRDLRRRANALAEGSTALSSARVTRGWTRTAVLCDGNHLPSGVRPGSALEYDLVAAPGGHIPVRGWLMNQWDKRDVLIKSAACIKGDRNLRSVASASIIAKVFRDRIMNNLKADTLGKGAGVPWGTFKHTVDPDTDEICYHFDETFNAEAPEVQDPYGLRSNKGYPTKAQMELVRTLGASLSHRLSFNPTTQLLLDQRLRMPCSMGERAVEFLLERRRREVAAKLAKDASRKRTRCSLTGDDGLPDPEDPAKKLRRRSSQPTLRDMFHGD